MGPSCQAAKVRSAAGAVPCLPGSEQRSGIGRCCCTSGPARSVAHEARCACSKASPRWQLRRACATVLVCKQDACCKALEADSMPALTANTTALALADSPNFRHLQTSEFAKYYRWPQISSSPTQQQSPQRPARYRGASAALAAQETTAWRAAGPTAS